jgi:hypothetical protein
MHKRLLILGLSCVSILASSIVAFPQGQPLSPTETVRQFYKNIREKKYKEALGLTIYKSAVDALSDKEMDDLRPDFERLAVAAAISGEMEFSGETISGDLATVFVKIKETAETAEKSQPVSLMKANGIWIIGDAESEAIVKKGGKKFFFDARINAHHDDVQDMLSRITLAQVVYNQGHNGQYGNLAELVSAGLVPKDIETPATTGYNFHVNRSTDGKTWWGSAEPAQYGRSGKLSFYVDATGVRSSDVGGKPLQIKN